MNQPSQHERITLRIPRSVYAKAKAGAEAEHISLNSFIVRATARATEKRPRKIEPSTLATAPQ
ncbi:toxin-antitoxin system HicB family antitoxin [Paracidovorax konjaci]|uniref:HicB family protein n=1 Tax=Paracidovorax konjaci TaxID=32040 RepID=A0A1I1YJ43_9BURK|nr:HicB family protein [Paracidovorax konjaci]